MNCACPVSRSSFPKAVRAPPDAARNLMSRSAAWQSLTSLYGPHTRSISAPSAEANSSRPATCVPGQVRSNACQSSSAISRVWTGRSRPSGVVTNRTASLPAIVWHSPQPTHNPFSTICASVSAFLNFFARAAMIAFQTLPDAAMQATSRPDPDGSFGEIIDPFLFHLISQTGVARAVYESIEKGPKVGVRRANGV